MNGTTSALFTDQLATRDASWMLWSKLELLLLADIKDSVRNPGEARVSEINGVNVT